MIITVHTENRTYVIEGADEITIESKHCLKGEQIPEEEGMQGFRWIEEE